MSVCIFMFGCSSDNSDEDIVIKGKHKTKGYAISTEGGNVVQVDSVTFFNTQRENVPARRSSIVPYLYDSVELKGFGYDRTEISLNNKAMSFSSNSNALKYLGLQKGIYIIRILRVYKKLSSYKPGVKIFVTDPDPSLYDMGTKTDNPYYNEALRGWTPDETQDKDNDGAFEGMTYILHIISNYAGMSINKYYPCSPEKLVWNYECLFEIE